MTMLQRHQLAHLSAAGWRAVLAAQPPAVAVHLQPWAERGLPLVVTRQPCVAQVDVVALGWPAPPATGCGRVGLRVPRRDIAWFDAFPPAVQALPLLPRRGRADVQGMLCRLEAVALQPRVYGSYGWELLTGERYVHAASDLDLCLAVTGLAQADAAVARLQACEAGTVRVDGELSFPGGVAVHWREYAAWRAGRTRSMLLKRLDGIALAEALPLPAWCEVEPA
jgi:phosphoribosyl-dephospho-CoA transferase